MWRITITILFSVAMLTSRLIAADPAPTELPAKVNLGAMVTELMKMQMEGSEMDLGIWMPFEFFVEAGQTRGASAKEAEKELSILRPYFILVTCRGNMTINNTYIYATDEEIRKQTTVVLPDGAKLTPIKSVPEDVERIAGRMKDGMSKSAGAEMAAHMSLLFFEIPAASRVDIADKSTVTVTFAAGNGLRETQLTWHTPFDAMNPPRPCSKCHELVSQKWSYCPYCGEKVKAAPGRPVKPGALDAEQGKL
jgi:hypothetical protein